MKKQEEALHPIIPHQERNPNSTNETTSVISRNIIQRHLQSFLDRDLEAVTADYTNESVFITQEATYKGPEEIKAFFTNLLAHFPKQGSIFELDKLVVADSLGYIVWHANTPSLEVPLGTDTFVIKNEKIYQQTFCGQMRFK